MRKMLLMLAVGALFLTNAAKAQDDEKNIKIVGSGNVITRDVAVNPFSQLHISGVFNVVLSQGDKEALKIEAEDNLQELILVENGESGLNLSMKKHVNIKSDKKLTVYITFKKIKLLDISTVGNVTSKGTLSFDDLALNNKSVGNVELNLSAHSLNLENKSVGNLELEGKADNAVVKNKSVGNFRAASFVVQTMDIDNNGIGNADVNAEKNLKLRSSGLGKVKNKGAGT
ncbi:MAG: DUF2807 domain-containing protein, partial [Chitinophagaceae bacterium]